MPFVSNVEPAIDRTTEPTFRMHSESFYGEHKCGSHIRHLHTLGRSAHRTNQDQQIQPTEWKVHQVTHRNDLFVTLDSHGKVACPSVCISFLNQEPIALHVLEIGGRGGCILL